MRASEKVKDINLMAKKSSLKAINTDYKPGVRQNFSKTPLKTLATTQQTDEGLTSDLGTNHGSLYRKDRNTSREHSKIINAGKKSFRYLNNSQPPKDRSRESHKIAQYIRQ